MARKRSRKKTTRADPPRKTTPRKTTPRGRQPSSSWRAVVATPVRRAFVIFAAGFAVHLVFLLASVELTAPVGAFFFGDGLHFLESARLAVAGGERLDAGLPFHPPLVGWLLLPLWLVFSPPAVYVAAKLLMAAITAAGYALFFLLIRRRVPHASWISLLIPFSFGELLLSSTVNGETVYRLLLLVLLLLGTRRPYLAGVVHGLAALTRAEHLPFALALLAGVVLLRPAWRPAALRMTAAAAVVLLPYAVATSLALADYNARHAEELPEPLPVIVPVSFYGPLNFALAQREEGIYFARRTLPPAPGGVAALDPTFPPHNRAIVHGYRLGLQAIADDPGRFLRRTARKLAFSLRALGYGFTWRDLPHSGRWSRPPVDMAHAGGPPWFLILAATLILAGVWRLRDARVLLVVGTLLVAYRLAVNVAFFPYLRSMVIVAPFWLCLFFTGAQNLAARAVSVLRGPRLLIALLALFAVFQLTAFRDRDYRLRGEREADGRLIDDRPVIIDFAGYRRSAK